MATLRLPDERLLRLPDEATLHRRDGNDAEREAAIDESAGKGRAHPDRLGCPAQRKLCHERHARHDQGQATGRAGIGIVAAVLLPGGT